MKTFRLLAILLAIVPLVASADNFIVDESFAYRDGSERCVMDIYYPVDKQAQKPVIIWFHGGGLTGGERFIPEQLKTDDYVVVAPGYRHL